MGYYWGEISLQTVFTDKGLRFILRGGKKAKAAASYLRPPLLFIDNDRDIRNLKDFARLLVLELNR